MEQAELLSKKRNLEGTSDPSNNNSFGILSNKEIMLRASKMGVDFPSNNFEQIDLLRELEKARDQLADKNLTKKVQSSSFAVDHDQGARTPLAIEWHSDTDVDSFTVVQSRKNRKYTSKSVPISRPVTRSQKSASASPLPPGRGARRRRTPEKYK